MQFYLMIPILILSGLSTYIIVDNWNFKYKTNKFFDEKIKFFEEYTGHAYAPDDFEEERKKIKKYIDDFHKLEWRIKELEKNLKKVDIKYEDIEKIVNSESYAKTKKILLHLDSAIKDLERTTFYEDGRTKYE